MSTSKDNPQLPKAKTKSLSSAKSYQRSSSGQKPPHTSKDSPVTAHKRDSISRNPQSKLTTKSVTVSGPGVCKTKPRSSSVSRLDVKASSSPSLSSRELYDGGREEKAEHGAISKLEKEIADLQRQNASLKQELCEVKTLHEQLLHESPCERFEEKRVNILKTQIFQLERQVLVLSQTVESNARVLLDVHVMIESLEEKLKTLCKDCTSRVGGEELVTNTKMIKGRLSKCGQRSSVEDLAQPFQFMSTYVRPTKLADSKSDIFHSSFHDDDINGRVPVTLIDACYGSSTSNLLNMKHIGALEAKLAELYRSLTQLQLALKTSPSTAWHLSVFQPMEEHCDGHVTESCKLTGECCHDLLCLSLLVPTAPRPTLKRVQMVPALTAKSVLKDKLPSSIRSRKEVKEAVDSIANTFCYLDSMNQLKCKALEDELLFHSSVYNLQNTYIKSLFEAVRNGYEHFEHSIQEMICVPLQGLLERYDNLSMSASDEALREFLLLFKEHHTQLKCVLQDLQRQTSQPAADPTCPQGVEALSVFGQQFFEQLKNLEAECSKARQERLQAQGKIVND